jgi:hypothetical protein
MFNDFHASSQNKKMAQYGDATIQKQPSVLRGDRFCKQKPRVAIGVNG